MTRLYLILSFATVLFNSCNSNKSEISDIKSYAISPVKTTICGPYKTKPHKELFYVDQRLILNSDSTFNYSCYSCLGVDTCYGRWSYVNDLITLSTTDELRKLKEQQNVFERLTLCDLNSQLIINNESNLLWQNSNSKADTLIKE
jgi:hypothetical protein